MELCNYCQQINPWSLLRLPKNWNGLHAPSPSVCNPHHKTFYLLKSSASTCPLCHLLYNALLDRGSKNTGVLDFNASVHLTSVTHGTPKFRDPELSELLVSCGELFVRLNAVAEEESRAARDGAVAGRMPCEAAGEDEAFETISAWFQKCICEHEVCRVHGEENLNKTELVDLPHRILDVRRVNEDEDATRLVETEIDNVERKGQYVALSHRWPTNHKDHFMTTRSVLEERKRVIKVEDMPANYRDAVIVARRLEIRYLWIDSLCIVQDEPEDWEREAALMGSIYHNSTITVMAATSLTENKKNTGRSEQKVDYSRAGFLGERKGLKDTRRVRLKYVDEKWKETEDYWEVIDNANLRRLNKESVLFTRGWVMQEEMLPRRIIYSPGQMKWICLETVISESNRKVYLETLGRKSNEGFIDHWLGIAMNYSQRNLTYESDKLPALSGLATHYSKLHKQEYFAGMFSGAIAETLLWQATHSRGLGKPKHYVAPSWSWLRPSGSIKMVAPLRGQGAVSQMNSALEDVRFELTSEVADAPYGRIKEGGLMRVRGFVKDVWMEGAETDSINSEVMQLSGDGKLIATFPLDYSDELESGSPGSGSAKWNVKCLWILNEYGYVLVLRAVVAKSDHYERIGIATADPAWLNLGGFRKEYVSII